MEGSVTEVLKGFRDSLTVSRVYGEPFEKNGVTVIPAASVFGGGGGGEGEDPDSPMGKASGSGFGMMARPAGAYVIRGDEVTWQPAIDVNRLVAALLAFLTLRLLLSRRRRFG
jgi:uncharacterized spore protein YtfJ